VTLDDSITQTPFTNLTYWFDVKNGVVLSYRYTRADFSRDDESLAGDDYEGQAAGIRYNRRFSSRTSGFIGYDFTNRNFEGLSENYEVHDGSVGFEHAFSPDVSLSLAGGYFTQRRERSNDEDGYTYNASLVKTFERGNISIGGSGGWYENFLEVERRGFTRYWSASANIDYQLQENLNSYAGGVYRKERDSQSQDREIWRGNIGLGWSFLRYFTLSLDYVFADRRDDDPTLNYRDNRITLRITAGKPYRW